MSTAMTIGIIFLIAGFILVGIEMCIPGFGVFGISGISCLVIGIFLTAQSIEQGIMFTIIVIVILAVMLTLMMLIVHSRKVISPMILNDEMKNNPEYIDEEDLEYLVSKEGVAITDLRPLGKGDFDGIQLDVKSDDGKFIKHDSKIQIVRVKDHVLSVKSL